MELSDTPFKKEVMSPEEKEEKRLKRIKDAETRKKNNENLNRKTIEPKYETPQQPKKVTDKQGNTKEEMLDTPNDMFSKGSGLTQHQKLQHRYKLLKGEIIAGNNNPLLIKEYNKLCKIFMK